MTRSPGFTRLTLSPTSLITPATSPPGENGGSALNWYLPWMMSVSGKLTPAALTLTTTWPLPGRRDGTCSTTSLSGGPNCLHSTALIRNKTSSTAKEHEGESVLDPFGEELLHFTPARLRHGPRALARFDRLLAHRRALHHAAHDALDDPGQAEHVVGHVVVPMLDAGAASAAAVRGDVLLFARDAQCVQVEPADAAELARREPEVHAVICEIGQRMPERRELPIEHRQNARLGTVEDDVVEAVVAVDHARLILRRNVLRQPLDELLHRLDLFGLRGAVLLRPATDLPLEVVAGLAIVVQTDGVVVDLVQRGDHAVHLFVDRGALGATHPRQGLVP